MKYKIPVFILILIIALGYFLSVPDIPLQVLKEKYCDSESRFMELDDLEVHYKIEGEGPAVVLIHGTAASLHTWDDWTERLKTNFKVIRMDIPAFGITGPNSDHNYSIPYYVEFVDHFLDKLEEDSVILAGNSLGGRIAWNYTQSHPERVRSLVLIDPSGLSLPGDPESSMGFKMAKTPVLNTLMTKVTPKSLHRKSILEVYFNPERVTEELIQRYYELMLRPGNRKAFVERVKVENKVNPPHLDKIECPTLIMWGKHDRWIPYTHSETYKELIKQAEVIIYEDAGHVPMEEIPEKSVNDFISFLEN